jgi:formylglycine-generating enzyme required for sulfatase activity
MQYRVYRGGEWFDDGASNLAARARYKNNPINRESGLAWRCVRARRASFTQKDSNQAGRVSRGGSWLSDAAYCRAARRYNNVPGYAGVNLGFRCARNA